MISRVVILVVLGAVLAVAPSSASGSPVSDAALAQCGTQLPVASYAHIVVIMEENLSWSVLRSGSFGQVYAPYINALMSSCRAYEAAGATDPSQANYMAATQGYWAYDSSGTQPCQQCISGSDNVFHQLDVAKLSWHAFEEGMSRSCYGASRNSPIYKPGHNPGYWYADLKAKGGDGSCQQNDTPFALGDPLAIVPGSDGHMHLPAFSWVTPAVCSDMHWSSTACMVPAGLTSAQARVQAGDRWLDSFLGYLFQAPDYQNGSTLVVLTWDEGNESGANLGLNCADPSVWPHNGSCQIGTVLISPSMSPVTQTLDPNGAPSPLFSHYSLLQLVERNFGLPTLGAPTPTPEFWGSYTDAPEFPIT